MKRSLIGLIGLVITFCIGIGGQSLFRFQPDVADKSKPIIVKVKPAESAPSRVIDSRELLGRGPIYSFPKTGIYFSTNKNKDEQSEFQFELTYEKNYKSRKIRGVNREYEVLVIDGSAFDQKSKFKDISIKIDKEKITLKTSKVKGIEYKFEGTFTEEKYFESDFGDQIVVLKGVLQKFSGGKKISEEETEFTYRVGC